MGARYLERTADELSKRAAWCCAMQPGRTDMFWQTTRNPSRSAMTVGKGITMTKLSNTSQLSCIQCCKRCLSRCCSCCFVPAPSPAPAFRGGVRVRSYGASRNLFPAADSFNGPLSRVTAERSAVASTCGCTSHGSSIAAQNRALA